MDTTPSTIINQSKFPNSLTKTAVFRSGVSCIKANKKDFCSRTNTPTVKSGENSYETPFRMVHLIADFTTVKPHPDTSGASTRKLIASNNNDFTIEKGKLYQKLIEENDKPQLKNLYDILLKQSIEKSHNQNILDFDNCEMPKFDILIQEASLIKSNLLIKSKNIEDKYNFAKLELHQNENICVHKKEKDDHNPNHFILFKSKINQEFNIESKSSKTKDLLNNQEEKHIYQSNIPKGAEKINDGTKKSPMKSLDIKDQIFTKENHSFNLGSTNLIRNPIKKEKNNFNEVSQIKSISIKNSDDKISFSFLNSRENIAEMKYIFSDNPSKKSNIGAHDSLSLLQDFEIKENELNEFENPELNILTRTMLERINDPVSETLENPKINPNYQQNNSQDSDNIPIRNQNKIRKRNLFESNFLRFL